MRSLDLRLQLVVQLESVHPFACRKSTLCLGLRQSQLPKSAAMDIQAYVFNHTSDTDNTLLRSTTTHLERTKHHILPSAAAISLTLSGLTACSLLDGSNGGSWGSRSWHCSELDTRAGRSIVVELNKPRESVAQSKAVRLGWNTAVHCTTCLYRKQMYLMQSNCWPALAWRLDLNCTMNLI